MTQPTLDDIKRSIRCNDDCRSHNGPPCNCTRRDKIALLMAVDNLLQELSDLAGCPLCDVDRGEKHQPDCQFGMLKAAEEAQ